MSASLCRTQPRPEESVVHPWSHEAEPHALSVLWDSQFLNYDNYFIRKKAGCEDKKLMHCKPLTQILSFCIKPLKKKASQHISSPLALFLCRHRFLIMQSFLFSEHISLCKLLPDSTLPSAYLALQTVHYILLGKPDPINSMDYVVKGYRGQDMHLLVQPALLAISKSQVFGFMCSTDWIPSSLKGTGLKFICIS